MIVLDTNIISEVMRPKPNSNVIAWLNHYSDGQLFVTTTTLAEIYYGLRILPDGQRKNNLKTRFDYFINQGFSQRILLFDLKAAIVYAEIMGLNKEMRHTMSFPDGQIVAITYIHRFSLATRNIKDFKHCQLTLVNPFEKIDLIK